ncbi:MAG: hypothetical protein NTW30_05370 [Candidatus Aenigmarchaeota archaeon]|nr:hypothetical protein [Candidatus Aenigmarchaeota archaeon]
MGLAFTWFCDNVIQSEQDDGWCYMYDFGSFCGINWCKISFGAWRDIGWLIFWPNFSADPPEPKPLYIDNFLIIDTPGVGLSIGGIGNDTYGCHSNLNSTIYSTCYVASELGPAEGVEVQFTLTYPDGTKKYLDHFTTDKSGIAQNAFSLKPTEAQGIYGITAVVDAIGLEDTTYFTYKCCLLIIGHSYDETTIYIDYMNLEDEGEGLIISVTPPKGYRFMYWRLNYFWISYSNTVYLQLNDDYILVARFGRKYGGGGCCGVHHCMC